LHETPHPAFGHLLPARWEKGNDMFRLGPQSGQRVPRSGG